MRLGTCIALEIVAALTAIGGLSLGTSFAVSELRGGHAAPRAALVHPAPAAAPARATAPAPITVSEDPARSDGPSRRPTPAAVPAPAIAASMQPAPAEVAPAPLPPAVSGALDGPDWQFVGVDDRGLLDPIRTGKLAKVKFNRGGSTLSLRIELDNGARAAFKPDQVILQLPRREIAAYRLDRLLGIGRVPPAIGRAFTMKELEAAVEPGQRGMIGRLRQDATPKKGVLKGAASWWIPVISDIKIGGARLDETDAIVTWRRWLRVGGTIPPDRVALAEQLSAMTLFDFLTDNIDRWSGNNAKSSEDGRVLYFMDNTMSFSRSRKGNYRSRLYLERCQVFSRRLVARLRALDPATLRATFAADPDPYPEILNEAELQALLGRREHALAYIDALIAQHGEEKVLAFP